jgi:hypothetical protein
MPQHFDRFKPVMERSFALRAFNQYETEINEHFWSFKVISEYSRFIAQAVKEVNPDKSTAAIFKASGPDAVRIPPTVSKWLEARQELENWLRLSALVSAASYLEVYLRRVVRSALMSDPLCRYQAPRALDGAKLLKENKELPYAHEIEQITRKGWNERIAAFVRLFGDQPPGIAEYVGTLERVRKIRNNFAHGFGRDLSVSDPSILDIKPAHRLNQKTFIKYIGSPSRSAALVDRYLLDGFIGNFELVHFHHRWKSESRDPKDARYDSARALQRSFNRDLSQIVSTEFCSELIGYYDTL